MSAEGVRQLKEPLIKRTDPAPATVVPPVPKTSMSIIPPDNTMGPLIASRPPVAGAIPNVPDVSVNAAGFATVSV